MHTLAVFVYAAHAISSNHPPKSHMVPEEIVASIAYHLIVFAKNAFSEETICPLFGLL